MSGIFLVRHASTAWTGERFCGTSDPPLDEGGRAAADAIAHDLRARLSETPRLVSSPSLRARQTADVIAAALGFDAVETDARWREVDFGIAEGRTFDELIDLAPDVASALIAGDVAVDWPGGEAASTFVRRVTAAWRALPDAGPVVVVSHGGTIRQAIALASGRPVTEVATPAAGSITLLGRSATERAGRGPTLAHGRLEP
jgi:probable phosphoglycerate mutase